MNVKFLSTREWIQYITQINKCDTKKVKYWVQYKLFNKYNRYFVYVKVIKAIDCSNIK